MDVSVPSRDANNDAPSSGVSSEKQKSTLSKNTTRPSTAPPSRNILIHRSMKRLHRAHPQSDTQKTTTSTAGPWLRKSTKPSVPPNPRSNNPFDILKVQPTTEESVEEMSDEETQSDVPDPVPLDESLGEDEPSREETEGEYTPIVDKENGDLIPNPAPEKGPKIPNHPFLSSDSSNINTN